jgi:cation:H+ antiporter
MDAFLPQGPVSGPLIYFLLFNASSLLMIWALGRMEKRGVEGTALGTLVMPYCSGLSNLIFAGQMGAEGSSNGTLVLENCLVNNATNLTLLIGLPALIWGMQILPKAKAKGKGKAKQLVQEVHHLNRLSLLLTLTAGLFFTGAFWAVAGDGVLTRRESFMLIGIFLFWQVFQVFDVMKYNVVKKQRQGFSILLDFLIVIAGGYIMFESIDWMVGWIVGMGDNFMGRGGLGWLSGWLMVLPNAFLAFYYTFKKRSDIAYSSQVGDGHICIPLCLGVYGLFVEKSHLDLPSFDMCLAVICGSLVIHIAFVLTLGRLPRWMGLLLVASYGVFIYNGLIGF